MAIFRLHRTRYLATRLATATVLPRLAERVERDLRLVDPDAIWRGDDRHSMREGNALDLLDQGVERGDRFAR